LSPSARATPTSRIRGSDATIQCRRSAPSTPTGAPPSLRCCSTSKSCLLTAGTHQERQRSGGGGIEARNGAQGSGPPTQMGTTRSMVRCSYAVAARGHRPRAVGGRPLFSSVARCSTTCGIGPRWLASLGFSARSPARTRWGPPSFTRTGSCCASGGGARSGSPDLWLRRAARKRRPVSGAVNRAGAPFCHVGAPAGGGLQDRGELSRERGARVAAERLCSHLRAHC
jgi:hypothetical protein